jgi:hypothetical protein
MKSVDEAARAAFDILNRDLPELEPTKLCSKCGPTKGPKPLSAYDKTTATRDGRHTICKKCRSSQRKDKRQAEKEAKSGTKLCIKCGPEKGPLPLGKFYRNSGTKDGRNTTCKDCMREAAKAKRIAKRGYEHKCPRCGVEHPGQPTTKGISRLCVNCKPQVEEATVPIDEETKDSTCPESSILDELFAGYPEMRTLIEEQAKEQFRTPKLQVLYMINRALTASAERKDEE